MRQGKRVTRGFVLRRHVVSALLADDLTTFCRRTDYSNNVRWLPIPSDAPVKCALVLHGLLFANGRHFPSIGRYDQFSSFILYSLAVQQADVLCCWVCAAVDVE